MRDDRLNAEIEEVIRASMKMDDVPAPELNHKLSLWYLPMVLNLIMFSLLALLALLMIENIYLSYFAVGLCVYVGMAGILLTIVGVKRANIKEDITIRIEKRGVLA